MVEKTLFQIVAAQSIKHVPNTVRSCVSVLPTTLQIFNRQLTFLGPFCRLAVGDSGDEEKVGKCIQKVHRKSQSAKCRATISPLPTRVSVGAWRGFVPYRRSESFFFSTFWWSLSDPRRSSDISPDQLNSPYPRFLSLSPL